MDLNKELSFQQMSSARRRRARRLYAYLIFEAVVANPRLVITAARKAQERGLYSPKSGVRDICFWLERSLFKLDKQTNPYAWCSLFDFTEWKKWNGFYW